MTDGTRRLLEETTRRSYGRLLARLASEFRDIQAAEDALAAAFASALEAWPTTGNPHNPEGWLVQAGRRSLLNMMRHKRVVDANASDVTDRHMERMDDTQPCPDERLKLMFVCTHPAIADDVRTPLMLQTVLGLDAAKIAAAYLVAPSAMSQRLVRAKTKIRDAGIRFDVPEPDAWPERLTSVLDTIYAAFGVGWEDVSSTFSASDLAEEAIYLCRILVRLVPKEPEAKGLLALMLYCEARRRARRNSLGDFVPLSKQDTRLWSRSMIMEAEQLLTSASKEQVFGRFQCQAAIQSVHAQRAVTGKTEHLAILSIYAMLIERAPSIGAYVGYAAAHLDAGHGRESLRLLDDLPETSVQSYQPYWVTRAFALAREGREAEARAAGDVAIALTRDAALVAYLRDRQAHRFADV